MAQRLVKGVVIRSTGGTEVLRVEDLQRPEPGEGEVLVKVRAASVNPVDWRYRGGFAERELPAVLGVDVSGTVEETRADGFLSGDEVYGVTSSGGYTQYATASAGAIAHKPVTLSHEQAAALPVSGLTAWQALFECARLQHGRRVLIAGAAGGVGHLAVQLAKHAGARVIGLGSSRSREFVLGLGADEFVDHTLVDALDSVQEVDVAVDTVGASTTALLLPTLREGGTLVSVAYPPEAAPQDHRLWVKPLIMRPSAEQLARIGELVASGAVRVEIAERFALADVRRAHRLSELRSVRGKIVLTVAERVAPPTARESAR